MVKLEEPAAKRLAGFRFGPFVQAFLGEAGPDGWTVHQGVVLALSRGLGKEDQVTPRPGTEGTRCLGSQEN